MNEQEKSELAWVTARLSEIQPYEKSPLGGAIIYAVEKHFREQFPKLIDEFQAAASEARKQRAEVANKVMATEGPKLWRVLHSHARIAVTDAKAEAQWLAQFGKMLPCGDCRAFLARYANDHLPDYRNYFNWTVGLHNAVNQKLGKPSLTPEQAAKLYA